MGRIPASTADGAIEEGRITPEIEMSNRGRITPTKSINYFNRRKAACYYKSCYSRVLQPTMSVGERPQSLPVGLKKECF